MPRRTRNHRHCKDQHDPEVIPLPVDIIDLTQDSPINTALRLSRARAGCNVQTVAEELEEGDSVILMDEIDNVPRTKKPKFNKPMIINLDETTNLNDNDKSVTSNKPGLNCPICLENLADDKIKAMTTPCGHVYCLECLKKVTMQKKKCSLCQRAISFSKCIRLHI